MILRPPKGPTFLVMPDPVPPGIPEPLRPATVHPVEVVLAGHVPTIGVPAPDSRAICACGAWRGVVRDWPAHLADVLDRAGLLAPADRI